MCPLPREAQSFEYWMPISDYKSQTTILGKKKHFREMKKNIGMTIAQKSKETRVGSGNVINLFILQQSHQVAYTFFSFHGWKCFFPYLFLVFFLSLSLCRYVCINVLICHTCILYGGNAVSNAHAQ